MLQGMREERWAAIEAVLLRRAERWTIDPGGMIRDLRQESTCLPAELAMTIWRLV